MNSASAERMPLPRVSVGVPVRNGAKYLEQTLDDLLSQTLDDLEIVVSDNCSTDRTPALLEFVSRRDDRVRVHRNQTDLGPAANYDAVLQMARADLFCWSAADDRHAPDFLARAVSALDADPTAVLATVGVRRIGPDGQDLGRVDGEPDMSSEDPSERLRNLIFVDHRRHGAHELFGLARRKTLRACGPQGAYARSDSVTLARLVLRGRFTRIEDELFFNRDHGERSSRVNPPRGWHDRGWAVHVLGGGPSPPDSWWDPSRAGSMVWPEWKLLREYVRAVEEAPLTLEERGRCRRVLATFAARHVPKLTRDVLIGAEFCVRRAADRGAS